MLSLHFDLEQDVESGSRVSTLSQENHHPANSGCQLTAAAKNVTTLRSESLKRIRRSHTVCALLPWLLSELTIWIIMRPITTVQTDPRAHELPAACKETTPIASTTSDIVDEYVQLYSSALCDIDSALTILIRPSKAILKVKLSFEYTATSCEPTIYLQCPKVSASFYAHHHPRQEC